MEYVLAIVALLLCIGYITLIVKSKKDDRPTIGAVFASNIIVFIAFYYYYHRSNQVEIKDWENLLKL